MARIVTLNAGMSEESQTAKLATLLEDAVRTAAASANVALEIHRIDLRPLSRPIADAMTTGFAAGALEDAQARVIRADGLIALTPTYQASYSGLFKSFVDVLPEDALQGMPVILGATGGTPRHSLMTEHAMRPLFVYMHAEPASTAVYAATEDWGAHAADSDGEDGARLPDRARRAAAELIAAAARRAQSAAPRHRDIPSPDSPQFQDFATLLREAGGAR